MKLFLLLFFAAIVLFYGCEDLDTARIPAVREFDVSKYCGKWYEIVRLPNWFEKDMYNVRAEYTLRPDGSVQVVNSGIKKGKQRSVTGRARLKGNDGKGELEVSFQWPFWGSYRIIKLDKDYRNAAVCGKNFDYLWILSRTPEISLAELNKTLEFLRLNGFEVSRLEFSQHAAPTK